MTIFVVIAYFVPVAVGALLFSFAAVLWRRQSRGPDSSMNDSTQVHNERIYKDFEMYLKVSLGLSAAFGYIRLEKYEAQPELARQALFMIGGIAILVMLIFGLFIVCHQGSKIKRWRKTNWVDMFFWQEVWACLLMWFFSSCMWWAALVW
jgi:hypothetical protein